jgi:hypothetical protein
MAGSLLNLISTPVPVLNTLGLNLRVGLSSEDPTTLNHPTEPYAAFLSVYSPEGILQERTQLGEIPPSRRRLFDISSITRRLVPHLDHLTVVHRVPLRLLDKVADVESPIDLPKDLRYPMFRSMVEYSYPQAGNGSVIYETSPGLNGADREEKTSNTLISTCQIVLSQVVNTYMALMNYPVDPSFPAIADFEFGIFSLAGEQLVSDHVSVGPFSVKVVDMAQVIPQEMVDRERDPLDGQSAFTFVGYSEDAVLIPLIVNASPELGAVAVEHTHPPQAYIFPSEANIKRKVKTEAASMWRSILATGRIGQL